MGFCPVDVSYLSGLARFIETFDYYLFILANNTLDICLLIFIDALDIYLDILSGSRRWGRIFLVFIFGFTLAQL